MESESSFNKPKPFNLILPIVFILLVINLLLFFLVQYQEQFWYPKAFLISPFDARVGSYGSMQELYMVVDDIEQSVDESNTAVYKIRLSPGNPDVLPEKEIYAYAPIEVDSDEVLKRTASFWDSNQQKYVTYAELSEGLYPGLKISDSVIAVAEKRFTGEKQFLTVTIRTIIR